MFCNSFKRIPYVLWTHLLKVHISLTLTLSGPAFKYVFLGPSIYKTFGNQWKENSIQYCLSSQSLWSYTISQSSTSKRLGVCVVDVYHNCFFTDCLGWFCLRNTSGNAQLQGWNLITFIPYVYFLWYSMLKWFWKIISNIAFWVYNHENV